jgi:hypothetical protein
MECVRFYSVVLAFFCSLLGIFRFGTPISLDSYQEEFFSEEEGAPRLAVKRLTRAIEGQLVENTINAPDWYV